MDIKTKPTPLILTFNEFNKVQHTYSINDLTWKLRGLERSFAIEK